VPERPEQHVLIAGVTTRALARSAADAGYQVTAVDAFGDLDLRSVAEVIQMPQGRYRAHAAAAAAAAVRAPMVAYTSNFENYPEAVAILAQGRRLLGNPPEVLARVRNPVQLMRALRRHGLATPRSCFLPPSAPAVRRPWLVKPRRSGGGHGIRLWRQGQPVPGSSYLQERMTGMPGSLVFVADGYRAAALGFSRQLVGDARLGSQAFRYCGSITVSSLDGLFPVAGELLERTTALACIVTREFGLVGVNGIDFLAQDGVPYPTEVNPRYSASMELVERALGTSMFQVHLEACHGVLPSGATLPETAHGKAIVFARRNSVVGDTRQWVDDPLLADVPHPGERISRGHPVCTVFAQARDGDACERLLAKRAAAIYRFLEAPRGRAA
jgi:uncharacterized protein